MNFIKRHYSKTFLKIVGYISTAMLLTVIVFSNTLYRNFERIGLKETYEFNKRSLSQLSINVDYMNSIVNNFGVEQYFEPDNQLLMYNDDIDSFNIQRSVNRLIKTVTSNSMIHSVSIYNNGIDKFYNTFSWISGKDDELIKLINENKGVSQLQPIPRILSKSVYGSSVKVFTYIMFDIYNDRGAIKSAFIMNVKTDWLLENLKKMKTADSNIYIVDKKWDIIIGGNNKTDGFETLDSDYINVISTDKKSGDSIVTNMGKGKKVITYLPVPNTEWILINDEPYETVFKYIDQIKYQTIIATLICLLLIILVSMVVSKIIYAPFGSLMIQVKGIFSERMAVREYKDDTEYLSEAFSLSTTRLESLEGYVKSTRDIIKDNLMKAILLGNMPEEEIGGNSSTGMYNEVLHEFYKDFGITMLLIIKIDRYNDLIKIEKEKRQAVHNNVLKLTDAALADCFKYEIVFLGDGEYVLIINTTESQKCMEDLNSRIPDIRNSVKSTTGFTVSAFVSDMADDPRLLHKYYMEALYHMESHKVKTENKHNVIVNSIMEYINIHFSNKDLSLKRVADEFKISQVHLGLIFKQNSNKSLAEYINELRIVKAGDLLKTTDYNVREIMDLVGYDNEGTFYKLFNRHFGTTPKEFRTNAVLQDKFTDE